MAMWIQQATTRWLEERQAAIPSLMAQDPVPTQDFANLLEGWAEQYAAEDPEETVREDLPEPSPTTQWILVEPEDPEETVQEDPPEPSPTTQWIPVDPEDPKETVQENPSEPRPATQWIPVDPEDPEEMAPEDPDDPRTALPRPTPAPSVLRHPLWSRQRPATYGDGD